MLEQNITLPGLSMNFPNIHCTADGTVCQLVTGTSEINAAGSTLALVLSPAFNLTKTHFLLAGIAGISPEVATIGGVTFAQFAVQVALQHEIDAREKPDNFSTGYIPLGTDSPGSYPKFIYGTEVFQLNDALRQRAMAFAKTATLNDSVEAQVYRQLYSTTPGYAAGTAPPSVVGCDTATADTWWSGELLGRAFENFTKLATNDSATYCTSQQEDNAVLESLLRGHIARRVDFSRVILMRTGSNFDRPPLGLAALDNLFPGMQGRAPALRNIYLAGIKVVEGILAGWNETFSEGVPAQNYIGDILGSLGGQPGFGPGSVFGGIGAPVQIAQEVLVRPAASHSWYVVNILSSLCTNFSV